MRCEVMNCNQEAFMEVEAVVVKNGNDTDEIIKVPICDSHFIDVCNSERGSR